MPHNLKFKVMTNEELKRSFETIVNLGGLTFGFAFGFLCVVLFAMEELAPISFGACMLLVASIEVSFIYLLFWRLKD